MISTRIFAAIVLLATTIMALPTTAQEWNVRFGMCGRDRVTCIVDGDTIWLQGVNLRLESYDTPEPYNDRPKWRWRNEPALGCCSSSAATRSR